MRHKSSNCLRRRRNSVSTAYFLRSTSRNPNRIAGQLEPINLRSKKLDFDGVDPQHGSVLLSVFWNRQHATGSAVYRPTFMRDMAVGGPYFSPLLLNAMFFVAAKHAPGLPGLDERAGMRFRRRVEEMLYDPRDPLICNSSITTAQALLLMSDALFSWCDERSLSWHYLGVAINMIVDLGIHCERSRQHAGSTEPPELLEVKRRLFWSAFGKLSQKELHL